jgi:TonB family protein
LLLGAVPAQAEVEDEGENEGEVEVENEGEAPSPPPSIPIPADLPQALDTPPVPYPPAAREAGLGGRAVIELQLDSNGVVIAAELLDDPGHGLGTAALAAAREVVFDSPPAEGPAQELRRYFYRVEFVPPQPSPPPDSAAADDDAGDDEPAPEMADELTVLPQLTREQQPDYPEAARQAGVQGEVLLELDLLDTGVLSAVRMLRAEPSGWGLELAAVRAAWKMRFSPAYAGEVPVPVRITYTYGFTLEEVVVETIADSPEEGEAIDLDGPVNFSGFVRERGSRHALSGVDVLIADLEHTTSTDDRGYFEFRGIPAGLHRAIVAVPGYHNFETQEEIQTGEATDVIYFLKERPRGVPETIVRTQREKKEVARRTITIETIERVPGTFGDPVRIVQNLPGVARSPFDFGLLLVRGSGPEDSAAHIDGIRIPQLFHFGGFRSIVTPILLDSVDFYPGGYGSRFGRLTGGILDVRSKTRYEDELHGLVQADLLDASAAITGPIRRKGDKKRIGGFVVAARRSYLDLVLPAIIPADTVDLGRIVFPQWTDIQGKITLHPSRDHDLSLLAFYSQDRAMSRSEDPGSAENDSTQGEFSFRNDFWRTNLSWTARKDKILRNDLTLSVGQDIQRFGLGQFATIDALAFWFLLRDEAELYLADWIELAFGTDIILGKYDFEFLFNSLDLRTLGSDPNAEREELLLADSNIGFAPALFVEGRFKLADQRIRITPGLRVDQYLVPGQFNFVTLDPRLSFRLTPDLKRRVDIKGSAGVYHQNPQGYEVLDATGNTSLDPEESYQFSLGTEIQLTDFLSVDLQGFYKRLVDLIVFDQSAALDDGFGSAWVNSGEGHIYGMELFLRWETHLSLEGWVALTLQRSMRRDRPEWDFYWYDFDQPVILDIVASYRLPFGFRIGVRWRYTSGNPETPIIASIYDSDADHYTPLQGEYNSERLPAFHALDIRIDKDFNFRRWKLTVYLDMLNVYNRKNPESRIYNFDYTEQTFLYSLPILPNLGFKAQF